MQLKTVFNGLQNTGTTLPDSPIFKKVDV